MLALRDLQATFYRAIAVPPGGPASVDAELLRAVEARERLGAADRLGIYTEMYRARLHDVLLDDFPRVAAFLGPDRFAAVVRAYLAAHPSTHPSVRHVGAAFAQFLAGTRGVEDLPFLADLARLEWARLEVFDAPDAEPLGMADVGDVDPAEWPLVAFELIPAATVLRTAWPVHEVWAATEPWEPRAVMPRETRLRVWRDGFVVYQASMDAVESLALAGVARREPFGALCTRLEAVMDAEDAAHEAARCVLRWIEDRVLVRAARGEPMAALRSRD